MNRRDVLVSIREWWEERRAARDAEAEQDPLVVGHRRDRRLRDANRQFTPHVEADIANPDRRPPADHQPHDDTRRLPTPWTRPVPRHAGTPDELEDL